MSKGCSIFWIILFSWKCSDWLPFWCRIFLFYNFSCSHFFYRWNVSIYGSSSPQTFLICATLSPISSSHCYSYYGVNFAVFSPKEIYKLGLILISFGDVVDISQNMSNGFIYLWLVILIAYLWVKMKGFSSFLLSISTNNCCWLFWSLQ